MNSELPRGRWFWIVFAGVLGYGCAAVPKGSAETADEVPTRTITWVKVADPNEPCSKLIPGKALWTMDGCADWRDDNNCVIYARPPANEADRQRILHLGHEVLHCFMGNFHRTGQAGG